MRWPWQNREAEPKQSVRLSWELLASHTLHERAKIIAEIAFADLANDRFGMTERAAFRIADALEKYNLADSEIGGGK